MKSYNLYVTAFGIFSLSDLSHVFMSLQTHYEKFDL